MDAAQPISLLTSLGQEKSVSLVKYTIRRVFYNFALLLHPDPASDHYYQPMWTLVGGGVKTLEQSRMSMKVVKMSSFKDVFNSNYRTCFRVRPSG